MEQALTPKQKNFAETYLDTGNATEAASRVYKPKNRATARSIGSENLAKPDIRAFLDEKSADAASMVYKLSQTAKNEAVRLAACKDVLDRAGYCYTEPPQYGLKPMIDLDAERRRVLDEIFPDPDED